jgi:hypothetical protein
LTHTDNDYDNVRNRLEKTLRELAKANKVIARLTDERDQVRKDLQKALFTKADMLAKEGTIDPNAKGSLRLIDPEIRKQASFIIMNKKISVVIFEFAGSQIIGVRGIN